MEYGLSITAKSRVRTLQGGAQSQLLLCDDGRYWVVKFRNNPQGVKILTNEMIATRLASLIGLPVPEVSVINVPESVIAEDSKMSLQLTKGRLESFLPGEHFGSAYVGGFMPGFVVDYLPGALLQTVRNTADFAGMLAFDKWTGNSDGRQAVFQKTSRERKYRAIFIDQGFCFNGSEWNFPDKALMGIYGRHSVYANVRGWDSFEPWLRRIEAVSEATLWRIAEGVPVQWYGGNTDSLRLLMNQLYIRRSHVRELILAFKYSHRNPFPSWE